MERVESGKTFCRGGETFLVVLQFSGIRARAVDSGGVNGEMG